MWDKRQKEGRYPVLHTTSNSSLLFRMTSLVRLFQVRVCLVIGMRVGSDQLLTFQVNPNLYLFESFY